MQIDPNLDPKGNELADEIIQDRASFAQLRGLLKEMSWFRKLAVVQIACDQVSATGPVQHIKLEPLGTFEYELQLAATLIRLLPPDTLIEIAIEILSEFQNQDRNE